jgi:hypothetical protein
LYLYRYVEAYLHHMGKETPQFCYEIAPKTLIVGLGSTQFRDATYTSHEVAVDQEQLDWFVKTVEEHPYEDGWQIFCFSHAPIIGSGLRVLQAGLHTTQGWMPLRVGCHFSPRYFVQSKNTVRFNR